MRLIGDGKNSILAGHTKLFWSATWRRREVTGGHDVLQRCILCIHTFINNSDRSPPEVVPIPLIFAKTLHEIEEKRLGPTIDLKEGRRDG